MPCSSGSVSRITPAGWILICFVTIALAIFLCKFWDKRRLKTKRKHELKNKGEETANGMEQDVEMTTVYEREQEGSTISVSASSPRVKRRTNASKSTDSLQRPLSLAQNISAELLKMSHKTGPALLPKIKIMLGIWQIIGGLPG